MARPAAPEGAKRLYFTEKFFNKIEKLAAEHADAKKQARKQAGMNMVISENEIAVGRALLAAWADIKETSGIKPPKPPKEAKAKKGAADEKPARKPRAKKADAEAKAEPKVRKPRAKKGEGVVDAAEKPARRSPLVKPPANPAEA